MSHFTDTQDRLAALSEKTLFFVVGAPKSGTTWLQTMLDAHPDVACKGEGHFTDSLIPLLARAIDAYNKGSRAKNEKQQRFGSPFDCPELDGGDLAHLATSAVLLAMSRWERPELKCIGEKTPGHGHAIGQLAAMFPKARFIHIIRDGRDGTVSCWFQDLKAGPEEIEEQGLTLTDYATRFGRGWNGLVSKIRAFAEAEPKRYAEITYEGLHQAPEDGMAKLFSFLGVDASDATVASCVAAGAFETKSGGRTRGDEQFGSFYRKGVVGDWRNHFDEDAARAFDAEAGPMLKALGYN